MKLITKQEEMLRIEKIDRAIERLMDVLETTNVSQSEIIYDAIADLVCLKYDI